MMTRLSIIVPVLNEAAGLGASLAALQPYRRRGHEVIVVDGGSRDGSAGLAAALADRVLHSERGRALQMNAGARAATGDILLFLHADSRLPDGADRLVRAALRERHCWGRFDLRLSGRRLSLRLVEWGINWRSALSGVSTGDQGIFVRREAFFRVGGFDPMPLMEDVALSKKLRKLAWPRRLRRPVLTSSRRWEEGGIVRTVLFMWRLRLAYFLGADPGRLVKAYYPADSA